MAKQSKRTKKFESSGGVKARLQKGTIVSKGKVKRKGKAKNKDVQEKVPKTSSYSLEQKKKREDEDFVSRKNLGDLDMDGFFESFADEQEPEIDEPEVSEDEDEEIDAEGSGDDDDDEDDNEQPSPQDDVEDDSSDDEDIEQAERKMKAEMAKLQKKDPEFHQFLEENDENLLQYAEEQEEDESDDEDQEGQDEDMDDTEQDGEDVADSSATRLTQQLLEKMEKGAFRMHGAKALKKFVTAFKSACFLARADEGKESTFRGKKYYIEDSQVFDRLMVLSLTRVQGEIHYHLFGKGSTGKKSKGDEEEEFEVDPNKPINPKQLEKSTRWLDIKPVLTTFFQSTMHLLTEAKEPELVVFVLKSLVDFVPYMTPFPRQAESMLKALTSLWSAPIDASEDYQVVRLHSFLRIRQLALTQPFPFIEDCLKKLYLAYAQRAKFATASSVNSALPTLTFMGNCVVELYSLDYHSSYQHAFIYIRQLALHLRTAMQKKTSEAMGAVYCWQYLHCLKLWVAVLTEACNGDQELGGGGDHLLQSLLFPLSQVILGTVRLIPSVRYLPLRLHCVRMLQQLAAAGEVFLPTTSILLDVLDLKELSQSPRKVNKNSNLQPMALTLRLRADNPLRTMEEMEMCVSETFVLLNREIDLYQYSAGFPEFSVRIGQRLRKFSKETRFARWRAYSKGCLDLCQRYSARAMADRAKLVDVAPKDVKQLEVLRPVNTPSMGERLRQAIEKEKRLEAATRPIQKATPSQSNGDGDSGPKTKSQKKRGKKRKAKDVERGVENESALEQEDQVEEGINWSDDEE
eukprot:Nitzschia sp. Nitz4//scaffold21_size171442//134955//137429//NITZ4_002184-RA/size171442-augustus-gene-0.191-mRNA-1//1//CDS//3329542480//1260//frame0